MKNANLKHYVGVKLVIMPFVEQDVITASNLSSIDKEISVQWNSNWGEGFSS